VHKGESVYCQSIVCLYLFFSLSPSCTVSLWRHFLKYFALGIQLVGTCIANSTCQKSPVPTANCILSSPVWCNKDLQLKWLKKKIYYWTLILQTATQTACQQSVFLTDWLVSTPQKFLSHNRVALVKTKAYKTVWMGNQFILQDLVFIWSSYLKNVISTIYFVLSV